MRAEAGSAVRPEWLYTVVRELQLAAGQLAEHHASGSPYRSADDLRSLLQRLEPPRTALEQLLLRGLLAECGARSAELGLDERAFPSEPLAGGAPDGLAASAKDLIDLHYAKLTTVRDIAAQSRCHPVHLERVFRRAYGTSVHRYLRLVRVRASLGLLRDANLKIGAVSAMVGFKARGSFYRAFREFTGRNPGQWRRGDDAVPSALFSNSTV